MRRNGLDFAPVKSMPKLGGYFALVSHRTHAKARGFAASRAAQVQVGAMAWSALRSSGLKRPGVKRGINGKHEVALDGGTDTGKEGRRLDAISDLVKDLVVPGGLTVETQALGVRPANRRRSRHPRWNAALDRPCSGTNLTIPAYLMLSRD